MAQFFATLQALLDNRIERDDEGATLVEYGLITGLIVAIALAAMAALGLAVDDLFADIATAVENAF